MNFKVLVLLNINILLQVANCKKYSVNQIKCLVCQRIVEEIENEIEKVAPHKKVDFGSYRLDGKGEIKKSTVELRRSEMFLTDVMDATCEKMNDYVRATQKSNGQLSVVKLIENGMMNPSLQDYDILTDGEIHTLKYHCESIIEEFEEMIMKLFRSAKDNIDIRLCSEAAKFCNQSIDEDYTFEDKDEL